MSKRKKQTSGNPARAALSFSGRVVVRDFERWMNESENTFTDPSTAQVGLEHLLAYSSRAGLDVLDPYDTEDIVDLLLELGPEGDGVLDLFHDYVHFRIEMDSEGDWEEAHELLEELLVSGDGLPDILSEALEDAAQLDPELRRQALAGVRIVARVREMLEWIGSGRAATVSGALRRADIAPVAAMLGISARGVAKRPPADEYRDGAIVVGGEAQVQSMWELPPLAAWWHALIAADLIELTRTRIRQGPATSGWLVEATPPLDDAASVVSVFTAHLLTEVPQRDRDVWNITLMRLTMAQAIAALDPDAVADVADPRNALEELLLPRAERSLEHLADAGLAVKEGPGRFRVPEMLRGAFARGVVLAMTVTAETLGEEDMPFADEEVEDPNPFDDPELKAEMERMGIVHTPGMAAEMLRELAPLLAEEGIDLDQLGGDDLDAVNSALARATERHNVELFTPVGEHRATALTVYRLVAEALAEDSANLARVVIDGIQPEPVGDLPSVAQVIGVGLGALDRWSRDPGRAPALARTQVPAWDHPAAVRAARDILRAARSGEAFEQLSALHQRHGGKLILTGTLLAVAGSVISLAAHEHVDVREIVGRVLSDG